MPHDSDVIVVGAGPAGATAARGLAQRGLRTVLLDRARFPRYKSCAGGIPLRTAHLLDFPLDSVVEDIVTGLTLSYLGRRAFTRWSPAPLVLMVMRDRFDALLAERACAAGAELHDGVALRSVERQGVGFLVGTDQGEYRAPYLVGADGANGLVARRLALGRGLTESVALEAEVCAGTDPLARWRGRMNIDVGYRPWGYAWVFPKAERLSIGVVLPPRAEVRSQLAGYLDRLGLAGARVERLVGHKILFRRRGVAIAGPGVVLVGDAAGLADEFSEEGIGYAIESGLLAAEAIGRASLTGASDLAAYQRAVERRIQPDLDAARLIARLFYASVSRSPRFVFATTPRISYIWDALFRVLRGESSYAAEVGRMPLLLRLATRDRHAA